MKICPVCHIEYADEAEFCAKCKAALIPKPEKEKAPFNGRRILIAIVCTVVFMLCIAGLQALMAWLASGGKL